MKQRRRVGLLRSFAVTDPSIGTNGFVKLVKRVVCPFVQNLDLFELAHRLDIIALRVNDSSHDSDCVIDVLGEGRLDKTYPVSLFSPVHVKFEDREYYAPAGYEEFLTTEYGDWRTPPAEKRSPCARYGSVSFMSAPSTGKGIRSLPGAPAQLSVKANMLWNSLGSMTYLACQWLITIVVVRLSSGYEDAGLLSLRYVGGRHFRHVCQL